MFRRVYETGMTGTTEAGAPPTLEMICKPLLIYPDAKYIHQIYSPDLKHGDSHPGPANSYKGAASPRNLWVSKLIIAARSDPLQSLLYFNA